MSNPEAAIAAPPRPKLGTLIGGLVLTCVLSAYFIFDAYVLREQVTVTNADGRDYVMRLYDPQQTAPYLMAGGMRIVDALQIAQQEAEALRSEIAERGAREQAYQVELAGLAEQLVEAEQRIAQLRIEVLALPGMREQVWQLERSDLERSDLGAVR